MLSVRHSPFELRPAVFTLREVIPPEAMARCKDTHGAGIRHLEGAGPTRLILSVDNDTGCRSRCEQMYVQELERVIAEKI